MDKSLADLDAVIFDMDGVVTETATVHASAWKKLFDKYLQDRADDGGDAFVEFDEGSDYERYVDGKNRYDGVRSFLATRRRTRRCAVSETARTSTSGPGSRRRASAPTSRPWS